MNIMFAFLLFLYLTAIGFVITHKFDLFIEHGGILDSPEGRRKAGILIYGYDNAIRTAKQMGILHTVLETPVFPDDKYSYAALLALSDKEEENLVLCREAYKNDPDICLIVRCINPAMKEWYEEMGACRVIMPNESVEEVLKDLWKILV